MVHDGKSSGMVQEVDPLGQLHLDREDCISPTEKGSSQTKQRPCKGQRERYRKLVKRSMDQIAANPVESSLALLETQLPSTVTNNVDLKNKFMARMQHALLRHQQNAEQPQLQQPWLQSQQMPLQVHRAEDVPMPWKLLDLHGCV
jgi:hypothetical protein